MWIFCKNKKKHTSLKYLKYYETEVSYKRDSWGIFQMCFLKAISQESLIPKPGALHEK